MTRWGYTARALGDDSPGPVRHAWDGLPAKRKHAPVHAVCGAALRGLGPRQEHFRADHPRACRRCAR